MTRQYNNPPADPSTIGNQIQNFFYFKTALIELVKEQYFGQLADVRTMPMHHGKKIIQYHYLPLLDDANINDQGIDAAGVTIDPDTFVVVVPRTAVTFTVEAAATAAAAAMNAIEAGWAVKSGSATPWTVTFDNKISPRTTEALATTASAAVPGAYLKQESGNLYGSSKDVGLIAGKLPLVGENGGRVNRVGFKRKEIEGTFERFGFFDEYTKDSLVFDTDAQLEMHLTREMTRGANEMTEDALQIDLLNSAGTIFYPGGALTDADLTEADEVTYGDLMRLNIALDNNRTPKQTKMITGSRMTDTKVIPGGRVAYHGSELIPLFESMKDLHNERALVPIEKYAAGGASARGEWGSMSHFRLVNVPEMMHWKGAGGPAPSTGEFHETNGRLDLFPILVVGEGSFTTIGFLTDGKSVKFTIYHKKPGQGTVDRNDPYGMTGLTSIQWWYGFMALRPERIGLIKTPARL